MLQSAAIVVAGGSGQRMSHDRPKQYLPLAGIPILARTLITFDRTPCVGRIIVVVPHGDIAYVTSQIVNRYHIGKARHIQTGGDTRQDSVRNGLQMIEDGDDIILIHDGARPLVTQGLIVCSIREAARSGAVIPVIPFPDTVKTIDNAGIVQNTPDRSRLRLAQTPQAFRREIILDAYERAYHEGFYGTDDASLVERMGVPVRTIPGSPHNFKITLPEDLLLGELVLERSN